MSHQTYLWDIAKSWHPGAARHVILNMCGPLPQGRCARRECPTERVTWFACALVKEKVEMCADEMPPKAQNKGCIRTCRETMSS